MNFMPHTTTVALVAGLILAAGPAWGVTVEATRAPSPPDLDGRLDDPCWQQAKPVTGFTVMNRTDPAKHPSTAYVVFDDTTLYIGVRCEEPNVASIKTAKMSRDGEVCRSDCIEIMLDPTMGKNDYYHFAVNASGSVFDRACTQGGYIGDTSWDAEVNARSFVGDKFWSCEVAIPFYSLGITPRVKSTWGLNICREKMDPSELSSIAEKGAFNIAASFVELRGMDVDFSRYCYGIGSPIAATLVKEGALNVQLDVPVLNETGQDENVLLECWLISPSEKPHITSTPTALAAGKEKSLSAGKFVLTEQGNYTCFVRVSTPDTKKPLAVKKSPLRIEYVPLAIRLIEPWYRDALFETQQIKEVALDLELRMNPEDLKGATAEVAIREAGSARPLGTKTIAKVSDKNRVTFDASKLPYGKLEIAAVLKDKDGNKLVDTTRPFQKLPSKPGEVWLGQDLQWRVDGKPFFINGAWNHPEDFIPEFNVFTTEMPGDVKLVTCNLMNDIYYKTGKRMQEGNLNAADLEMCRAIARRFKDHPRFFAYYLSDEPECGNYSAHAMEQAYQVVRDEDPYHPIIVSNDSLEGLKNYARCAEINGLHPYPVILKDKRINDLTAVASFVETARKLFHESAHKQTIAYLHQGFNYGDEGAVNNRIPNYLEYRNQDLLAIICGAKGFLQFNRSVAHYPELSIGMPHLTKELAYLGPVVLAPQAAVTPTSSSKTMKMLLKELDGDLYLLACNAAMEPCDATITIPGASQRAKRFNVISEERTVKIKKDAFTDHFDTFEAHVYTTSKKKPDLLTVKAICRLIDEANQKRRKPGNLVFQMFEGDEVVVRASTNAGGGRRPENGLWHMVDGVLDLGETGGIDPYNQLRWKDTTPNEFPDWLEIQMPAPRRVGRVVVYPFKKSLKDYAVQAWVGGEWKDVGKVAGKNDDRITHIFEPVTTDRIRIWITATNGPHSWVTEVEVYEK